MKRRTIRQLYWIFPVIGTLFMLGRFVLTPLWLPTAIAYAPNFGKAMLPTEDPTAEQLNGVGISRPLRVAVGPPVASLSIWIMEPSAGTGRSRGTILVLHGIRDRKDSMRGIGGMLAEAGYRAVLVDLRGHGRSSGDWLTWRRRLE